MHIDALRWSSGAHITSWCSSRPLSAGVTLASVLRRPRTLSSTDSGAVPPPMSVCTQPGSMVTNVAPG